MRMQKGKEKNLQQQEVREKEKERDRESEDDLRRGKEREFASSLSPDSEDDEDISIASLREMVVMQLIVSYNLYRTLCGLAEEQTGSDENPLANDIDEIKVVLGERKDWSFFTFVAVCGFGVSMLLVLLFSSVR